MSKKLVNYHTLHSVHIHRQKVILEFIHIVIVIIIVVVIIILKKKMKQKILIKTYYVFARDRTGDLPRVRRM